MMNWKIFLLISSVIACVCADHSFKNTAVKEFDQEKFHLETGIGRGKNNMKADVFIMFYAKWCPHCQKLMPDWIKLKAEHKDASIVAVHCPDNQDLCQTFKVNSYPTLILVAKDSYKQCTFKEARTLDSLTAFWLRKCEGQTIEDIPYRVAEIFELEDEQLEKTQPKQNLDGSPEPNESKKNPSPEVDIEETEKNKEVKRFKSQKNIAYEEKILQFKDYLKKLGPLVVIFAIALCLISVTFICNKCCSYDEEDPFSKQIIRDISQKSKGKYSSANISDLDNSRI